MKMQEVREIAKNWSIKTANIKKTDLIRSIQLAEGNFDCYCTGHADKCGQENCIWHEDCF
ncbi:MAG: SAP domain-containing protein [Deltaproteobacteria bacterium]